MLFQGRKKQEEHPQVAVFGMELSDYSISQIPGPIKSFKRLSKIIIQQCVQVGN